jgi:integrase
VLPVLLRVLYSSGLRLSEALELRQEDVDLKEGCLSIRNTKFDKSRKIPLSASMVNICRIYVSKMRNAFKETAFFFPSPDGGQYAESTIYSRFRDMLLAAGISHGGRGNGPRLHDFRHTFAVHSLQKLAAEGVDLYVTLPILSAYMGHKSLAFTQQYLRLTPECYNDVTGAFEERFGSVFPEAAAQ